MSLVVKNYYALQEAELDKSIAKIRAWLFDFQNHPQRPKALLALEVALCAKELPRDEFADLLTNCLISDSIEGVKE